MKYLIGCDVGTSGTKTVLFDESGKIISSAYRSYPLYQPETGWAEQDPDGWADAAFVTIAEAVAESGVDPSDVAGIGLSGQMHGLVMLDEKGKVLRKSIIWCDQRTQEECVLLTSLIGVDRLKRITGNPAITGFTAPKILWVQRHEPETWRKCAHILLPKDYVRFRLTGQLITDMADGSGMQLADIGERRYSKEMLGALSIDENMVPVLKESASEGGRLTAEAAKKCGLRQGLPVAASAGDQAAAAIGNGVVREGLFSCNVGTSGVVFAHTDTPLCDPSGRVQTFCHAVPGKWHVMGVTQGAGLSMKWFKDNFYAEEAARNPKVYKVIDDGAATISEAGAHGLFYLPYLMGERTPHLDPKAKGVFFGITPSHKREDFARAVMEGVGYSLLDCLNVISELGGRPDEIRLCGGGTNSALWRRMLTDIFGCECVTTNSTEAGALGAAILAGVASGTYHDVNSACERMIRVTERYTPDERNAEIYAERYPVYRGLYAALKDSFAAAENFYR